MNNEIAGEDRARGSPAAIALEMAPLALKRIGDLLAREDTDARLLVQAARLALWATQLSAETADGGLELAFTGGMDGEA